MSRYITVFYQIELPDDFEKMKNAMTTYDPIHKELGQKLKGLGVDLGAPRVMDADKPAYTGKPRGRRPGPPKIVVELGKVHGTNGHDDPPDIAA